MKNLLAPLLHLLQRRFAPPGLIGALAITVTWWSIVAHGVRLAIAWAVA